MMIPDELLVCGLERQVCLSADWKRWLSIDDPGVGDSWWLIDNLELVILEKQFSIDDFQSPLYLPIGGKTYPWILWRVFQS